MRRLKFLIFQLVLLLGKCTALPTNTSINLLGCWLEGDVQTNVPCGCFQNATSHEDCHTATKTLFRTPGCEALINATYTVQHRSDLNDIEFTIYLNDSVTATVTLVVGNCSFDCSGESDSPCPLFMQSLPLAVGKAVEGPVHFNVSNQPAGSFCLMVKLNEEASCILYSRSYTFELLPVNLTVDVQVRRTSAVFSILLAAFLSAIAFIYVFLFLLHKQLATMNVVGFLTRPRQPDVVYTR